VVCNYFLRKFVKTTLPLPLIKTLIVYE